MRQRFCASWGNRRSAHGPGCYFSHMTTSEIAAFYDDGTKAGALIRHVSEGLIQTTLAFKGAGGPLIHLFQETRFDSDVRDWSAYTYVDHLENSVLEVRSEALPTWPDLPEKPIPSYAAHLVLKDFLATADLRRDFSQFDESDPSMISAAAFVRHGPENVETPWGSQEALKVALEIDGHEGNTFWCADGSVVKSDWQGATSFTTKEVDSVLEGLDADVQTILRAALA